MVINSGVMFTESFISSKWCNITATKAHRVLGVIKETAPSRDSAVITALYKSLVRPHDQFAVQALSAYFIRSLTPKEKHSIGLQNDFACGKNYRTRSDNLTTLKIRKIRADVIEVFLIKKHE